MNFNRNKKPKDEQEDDGKKGEHKQRVHFKENAC